MNIPFLKLPYVVQLEVLKQMECQEVFLLSLCSEKSKRVAQSLIMRPMKIVYAFHEKRVLVSVALDDQYDRIHCVANMKFVSSIPSDQMRPVTLGGKEISCIFVNEISTRNKFIHAIHCLEEHSALESLQIHMNNLFRYQPHIELYVYSLCSMYQSGIIKNVTDSCFKIDEFNTEQLDKLLVIYPNQNSLHLTTKLIGPPFRNDSKLWALKGLAFRKVEDAIVGREIDEKCSEIIRNFGGKYLLMFNVVYDIDDWIHVIRNWKTKEAYQKLKCLYTKAPRGTAIEHAMTEFNFVKWDGQRRPRIAKFDPKIINIVTSFSEGHDCSHWLDIQQDGGGKWASIKMTHNSIDFAVWD
ncbi:hypothetical protein GCK72_004205 [Caenorhabditis remanei]|uniref:F-box domain-containing protein n=1 Tax=Caenorhabditis remanei TaxID=31234 RepID=A0A6A5H945_CAERE|nr:hypothetical protein GCK72_004205 [Caenorhabditis remanei]KAF1764258.1 hypothetical protein GCK72_004205 [Caenorhabditis remanei]